MTFDLIPTEDLYDEYFNFKYVEEESVTDQFEIVGYGSTKMIRNMGSKFLILVLTTLWALLIAFLRFIVHQLKFMKIDRIRKWVDSSYEGIFWNSFIETIN